MPRMAPSDARARPGLPFGPARVKAAASRPFPTPLEAWARFLERMNPWPRSRPSPPRFAAGQARGPPAAFVVKAIFPAVIYGGGEAPTPITLNYRDVNKLIYAGHFLTTIFDIEIDGKWSAPFRAIISSMSCATRRCMSISCA